MANSNHIPWTRLTIEGGAIVVSILLAFWIDAWWDSRNEQIALNEDLSTLGQEISQNLDDIEMRLELISAVFEKIDYVFDVLANSENQDLPDSFVIDLAAAYNMWGTDVTSNAFDVVLSPDNLRLIENPDLRMRIAQTNESIADFDGQYDRLYREYSDNQTPYLVRTIVVSDFAWYEGGLLTEQYDYGPLTNSGMIHSVPASRFTIDAEAVKSREFWNMLYVWRSFYLDYTFTLLEAKKEHELTLELLESEISKH